MKWEKLSGIKNGTRIKGLDDRISIFLECKVSFISSKEKPVPTQIYAIGLTLIYRESTLWN